MRPNIGIFTNKNAEKIILLAPIVAFILPLVWLYLSDPVSFDNLWKGRTFELFFVWLILLELILGWDTLQKGWVNKLSRVKLVALLIALLLPSIYVLASTSFGLNAAIKNSAQQGGISLYGDMPAAVEYLVFAGFFSLMAFLILGFGGLKRFSIPILFSVIIGAVFIIDSVYPNGQFTPFQFLVPVTTILATNTLNLMGYSTTLDLSNGNLPSLTVTTPNSMATAGPYSIAWPCAGIESLLIFTVTIMLFLKRMPISWQAKIGYFAFGAGVTYFINILRIVSLYLFVIGGGNMILFHQTYGPLYPIAWIVTYPLLILGSQSLWHRIRNRQKEATS